MSRMFSWRYFLGKKLHSSFFIAWCAAAIIVGVVVAQLSGGTFANAAIFISALVLLASIFSARRAWMVGLAIVAGLFLGLWRGGVEQQQLAVYRIYQVKTVIVSGTVNEDTSTSKQGQQTIVLGDISIADKRLPGKLWLSSPTSKKIQRSDRLSVEGKLKSGFGSFAASMSFAKVVSHAKGIDEARDVRDWFSTQIRKIISEPEASLGIGFLVGQRSSLPDELDQQLRVVGLTHIVVASGYNLTVLVRLSRKLFSRISKYFVAFFGSLLIGGFILVTGFSPSMSRAGLVAGLSLLAWYYGRKISPFVLLPLAAAVTLLVNPSYGWGDVGWYLSFAAFGGVMIAAPLLQHYFFGSDKPNFIRQVLGETVAALLVTAPIIMLVFGQYSPYALLSNLLVVPVIPYIMLGVFVAGLTSAFVPIFAPVLSLPSAGLLHYVTMVVQWIAALPGAQTELQISGLGVGAYYLCLLGGSFYLWFKTKHDFREDNLVE